MNSRRRGMVLIAAGLLVAGATACGGASSSPGVPRLGTGSSASGGHQVALHAVGECVRQHSIPGYQDPVLAPDGHVYSDQRSLQNAPRSAIDAVIHACAGLAAQAGFNPTEEPPAPPNLVQAGVRAAECLRAHGLSNMRDPTSQSPYTPGHGFGLTPDEVPAGGKADPLFQRAAQACRALLDAEIRASTLSGLGHD